MSEYIRTPTLGLYKPLEGGDINLWGGHLNQNSDILDAAVSAITVDTGSIINVLDHGAAGNGVADDTAAIQAVLNAQANKAVVFMPWPGAPYMVTGLTIPGGTNLILDGVIKLLPNSLAAVVTVLNTNNVIISGFGYIDGNAAVQSHPEIGMAGLAISGSNNIRVSGITLQDAYWWNLNCTGSSNVRFTGVNFIGGHAANEIAAVCDDCWIINCTIDGTGLADYAFCFYGGITNSGAIGNVVKNAGAGTAATVHSPGIGVMSDAANPDTLKPSHNIIIADNIIHDCAGPGLVVLGADATRITTGVTLSNNRLYNNDKNGEGFVAGADVFIDFASDITVTGNSISANGNPAGPYYTGIFLGPHSSRLNVTDNQIYDIGKGFGPAPGASPNAGIYAQNPPDAYIANNHFYDTQTTPSMQVSLTGGFGARCAIIGNYFGRPAGAGYPADTVYANGAISGGKAYWEIRGTELFSTNITPAPPTFSTRSDGTRIVLFPQVDAANVDWAIGIDSSTFWQSIGNTAPSSAFKWYAGQTVIASLKGTGEFTVGRLNLSALPTSATGLTAGDVWRDGTGGLHIV